MKYGSLFSGIEAASVAWKPLGWRCAWVAEIDPFACAALAHHYPNVPNLGDVSRIDADAIEPVDLIVFGSPCQSFSVAGKRLGLDDPRGNMALVALRLVERIRPRWLVFENVPGLLSSDGGRDFGAFLGLLGECGYGWAYRTLDAQHFGVPQRRRRVFVVGHLGDWRPAAAVLFEPESLRGDSAPRREMGEGVARPVASCAEGGSGYRGQAVAFHENQRAEVTFNDTAGSLKVGGGKPGQGYPAIAVAFQEAQTGVREYADAGSLRANGPGHDPVGTRIRSGMSVRRLLPVECERLQGLPEIRKTAIILACSSDHQKTSALAEIRNPKSPLFVSTAAASGLPQTVKPADENFSISLLCRDWPVVLHVLIDLERNVAEIRKAGKLLWSASIAGSDSSSLHRASVADFARRAAQVAGAWEPTTTAGKAASQQSSSGSLAPRNGSEFVAISGREIADAVASAESGISEASGFTKSTTSPSGGTSRNCEQIRETSSCFVMAAISGFIPEPILSAGSYAVSVETVSGYTLIPYRGKPAADGPRYRVIGNSFAVPCVRWIGHRIQQFESAMRPSAKERAA